MKILLLVLFFSMALSTFAQDSTFSKNNAIRFKPFNGYRQNGHKLSEKELKTELYKIPAAIPFYKKAVTRKITGLLLFAGGTASLLCTNYGVYDIHRRKVKPGTIIGFASIFAGVPVLISSFKQLKKSIALHNQAKRIIY